MGQPYTTIGQDFFSDDDSVDIYFSSDSYEDYSSAELAGVASITGSDLP